MKQKKFSIKELFNIFQKELKIKVKENNKLYDFKQWDSLANFNILLACEKKFKIKFSSKEFTNLKSFKEISKVVKKKI